MALIVDEERGRARRAAQIRRLDVLRDMSGEATQQEVLTEAVGVKAEPARVGDQVVVLEVGLVGQQQSCIGLSAPWASAASAASWAVRVHVL
jgi:hypothetical protein